MASSGVAWSDSLFQSPDGTPPPHTHNPQVCRVQPLGLGPTVKGEGEQVGGPGGAAAAGGGRMGDKKDGFEDMGLEGSAFEALERDFQEVLQDLVGDKSLERFRVEYEKLHRALKSRTRARNASSRNAAS